MIFIKDALLLFVALVVQVQISSLIINKKLITSTEQFCVIALRKIILFLIVIVLPVSIQLYTSFNASLMQFIQHYFSL